MESDFVLSTKGGIFEALSGLESVSGIKNGMSFELVDLSNLSLEALDDLLSRSSVKMESEDGLLIFILKFGLSYRFLLPTLKLVF
jgi:hypothetical protein